MGGLELNDRRQRRLRILTFLMPLLMFATPALADPPPGTPEVNNTFCSTWNNGTGICDDYNAAHDLTNSAEWVEAHYEFTMHDTNSFTIEMEWELHEFNRSALGLEGMDLGGDFDLEASGAPADYIRNYLSHQTPAGIQVRQMVLDTFSSEVAEVANSTFNAETSVTSMMVDEVTIDGVQVQCSEDGTEDSADEVAGLPNNAFQPPLCLRSVANVEVGMDILGLGLTGEQIERALQGLLTMGGEVTTDFTLLSRPGHKATYVLHPPEYATVLEATNGVTVPNQVGSVTYSYAQWQVDGLQEGGGANNTEITTEVLLARRDGVTSAVDIDMEVDTGITVDLILDMRDSSNTMVHSSADIHYLPYSTLEGWGFELEVDGIDVPWMTADGIRMANEFGLIEAENFTSLIPIEPFEEKLSNDTGLDIEMSPIEWAESDLQGGLDFMHRPGITCGESIAHSHCLQGANAMGIAHPVTLRSTSDPFQLDPIQTLLDLANERGYVENLTSVAEADVAAILSIFSYENELNTSIVADLIPEGLPRTVINLEIMLPDWVQTADGETSIFLTATSDGGEDTPISFTGRNPYHQRWDDAICSESASCTDSSDDLVCYSDWKTCISIEAMLDVSELNILEWSQAVEVVLEASVDIKLYRIGVPDTFTDESGITIEAIPADAIRHLIAIGDETPGGATALAGEVIEVPIGDEIHVLELSNSGLNSFADSLADMVNAEMEAMEVDEDQFKADLSGLRFEAQIDHMQRPYDDHIDDDDPIRIRLSVPKTTIMAQYSDGGVIVETSSGQGLLVGFIEGMLQTFDFMAAGKNDGLVTFPEDPLVFDVDPIVHSEDIDTEVDSDSDGQTDNDQDIIVRPAVIFEISLPKGLELEFSSSLGLDREVVLPDGRSQIIYRVPLCSSDDLDECDAQRDEVQVRFTVGYDFLFQEIMPYFLGLSSLLLLFFVRRIRKRRKKKERLEEQRVKVVATNSNTMSVERELLGLPSATAPIGGNDDWLTGLDMDEEW